MFHKIFNDIRICETTNGRVGTKKQSQTKNSQTTALVHWLAVMKLELLNT